MALDDLVELYNEDDIITDRRLMPIIKYIVKNKEHRYYPDIWIKSKNKIIEVKSMWTYNQNQNLVKNILKALSSRRNGYEFEFWIYTKEKQNIYSKIVI